MAAARGVRAVTVTSHSLGASGGTRTIHGLLGSLGLTTVAAKAGRMVSPPAVTTGVSEVGGSVSCHSRAVPFSRSFATVSICRSSTCTRMSASADKPASAVVVPGGSQLTSRMSVGPRASGLAASCSAVAGVRFSAVGVSPRVPTVTFATFSAGGRVSVKVLMAALGNPKSNPTSPFAARGDTGTSACTVTVWSPALSASTVSPSASAVRTGSLPSAVLALTTAAR